MKHVRHASVEPFEFYGLEIRDLTKGIESGGSVALIDVGSGVAHPPARSSRCEKIYICLAGLVEFQVNSEKCLLAEGDLLTIQPNEWFRYVAAEGARLLLVHVPPFDLDSEELAEQMPN